MYFSDCIFALRALLNSWGQPFPERVREKAFPDGGRGTAVAVDEVEIPIRKIKEVRYGYNTIYKFKYGDKDSEKG